MLVAVSERPSHSTSLKSRVALLSVHAPRVISVIGFMQFWNGKQNSPVHDWHWPQPPSPQTRLPQQWFNKNQMLFDDHFVKNKQISNSLSAADLGCILLTLLAASEGQQHGCRDTTPLKRYLSEIICLPPKQTLWLFKRASASRLFPNGFSTFAVSYFISLHRTIS